MPTVPTYDGLQVSQNTVPDVGFNQLQGRQFAVDPGQQASEMGQGLSQSAVGMAHIANDMASQIRQSRFDDATNQAREDDIVLRYGDNKGQASQEPGYLNLFGKDALQRPDGKSLIDEYAVKKQQKLAAIAQSLGDDQELQSAFAHFAGGALAGFKENVAQHTVREQVNYSLSTADGMQKGGMEDVMNNYNNPLGVDDGIRRIEAGAVRQAQWSGKSATWAEAQSNSLVSNSLKGAALAALQNNGPGYANAFMQKYSKRMSADDLLTVQGHITKDMTLQLGYDKANSVMSQFQPRIQVGETERAFNVLVGAESAGNQLDAQGQPLTSSAGAIGIAQVMPDTAKKAAKLAGIPWDENKYRTDANYNRALGLAHFQSLLQGYGGDLAKSYAAYNAGEGWVDAAVKRATDAPPGTQESDWFWQLNHDGRSDSNRKQTQDYVTNNMNEFNSGKGQPTPPTMFEIENKLRSDPELAANPQALKMSIDEATRQYKVQKEAIKEQEDKGTADAIRGLAQNGGDFAALDSATRNAIPPRDLPTVLGFADRQSKRDDKTSMWLYNKLTNNPDTLAKMSDDQFYKLRPELSEQDFKHFSDRRAKLNGDVASHAGDPGDLDHSAVKQALDAQLRLLNIDPTPKDEKGSEAQQVGAIRAFVDQSILSAQGEAGKKFNDTEIASHLNKLAAQNVQYRGMFNHISFFGYKSKSTMPLMSMKVGDIPSEEKDSIVQAFEKQGNSDPTDAQILNLYLLGQASNGR